MQKKIFYELIMSVLAVIAVILAIIDINSGLVQWESVLDNAILVVFIADYILRFVKASNKKKFVKSNIFDLIAIIPFNSVFRVFRIAKLSKLTRLSKLVKLSRLLAYLMRVVKKFNKFVNTNGFKYMIMVTFVFMIVGGITIHYAEGLSLADGMWWAFVTTTTIGYGDIVPYTLIGRFIAIVLMILGIGLIGALTSTITSYFFTSSNKKSIKDETLDNIKKQLDDISNLSDEDIDVISSILKSLNKVNNKY